MNARIRIETATVGVGGLTVSSNQIGLRVNGGQLGPHFHLSLHNPRPASLALYLRWFRNDNLSYALVGADTAAHANPFPSICTFGRGLEFMAVLPPDNSGKNTIRIRLVQIQECWTSPTSGCVLGAGNLTTYGLILAHVLQGV